MARVALLAVLFALLPLAGVPDALATCASAGPAGVCADAALDGTSSSFACVGTVAGAACATGATRSTNLTEERARVCALGPTVPPTCQDASTRDALAAVPDPNNLDPNDVVATAMGVVGTVSGVTGPIIRELDDFLPCNGVPPRQCPL